MRKHAPLIAVLVGSPALLPRRPFNDAPVVLVTPPGGPTYAGADPQLPAMHEVAYGATVASTEPWQLRVAGRSARHNKADAATEDARVERALIKRWRKASRAWGRRVF